MFSTFSSNNNDDDDHNNKNNSPVGVSLGFDFNAVVGLVGVSMVVFEICYKDGNHVTKRRFANHA